MTKMIKREERMEVPAKTYLQTYEEHISGYRQYKLERVGQLAQSSRELSDEVTGADAHIRSGT